MFEEGKKRAKKLRQAIKLVQECGEELASFVEVERYPDSDAAASEAMVSLTISLGKLTFILEET